MIIDRHNCEAFFLDYHEGNLSPVQQGEVLLFLEENPDLKNVFEGYENISLEKEPISFPGKTEMKKKYSAEGIESLLSSEINSDNCEQFFIAFVEGQLSVERISKLNSFLASTPNQQKEFELFKKTKLSTEKVSFEKKELLKKFFITKENREEYFIRSVEKDLNRVEEEQLKLFLQRNPEYKKECKLFAKAILPAEEIVFAGKSSLKKKERKPVFVSIFSQRTAYYAVAASLLLLLGLFFIFRNNESEKQMFADKTNKENKTIVKVKKENVEPVKEKEQPTAPEKQIQNNEQSNVKPEHPSSAIRHPSENKEEIKRQPILIEDNENLIAEKENEKPKMMEQEVIAEKKQKEKKEDEINPNQAMASAVTAKPASEYQTVGSFAKRKIKKALGIQNANPCEPEDKLTVWDFAMAAKNKVQDIIGTKAVDVEKVCDGNGDSEYVFSAGNFEFSRSASK